VYSSIAWSGLTAADQRVVALGGIGELSRVGRSSHSPSGTLR
jgi:hypothetical protein